MSHQTYAPLRTSFWTDPKVRTSLPGDGKYMATYWFSAPGSNMAGLFHCDYASAAKHVDRSIEFVRFHTQITCSPYVTYDEQTEEVFVHAAAKHRIGETLKEKDTRRRTLERLWKDCHSPYLRSAFAQRYVAWELNLGGVLVPAGYKHVAPPLPLPPMGHAMGHGMGHTMGHTMPLSEAVTQQSRTDKETTGAEVIEKKPEANPGAEWGELMGCIRDVAGLGKLDGQRIARSASVAKQMIQNGETPIRIMAAIDGVRHMADRGQLKDWLKPFEPFDLRALNNTHTLVNHHSGETIKRRLFDVALEVDSPKARKGGAPTPIADVMAHVLGGGHAA